MQHPGMEQAACWAENQGTGDEEWKMGLMSIGTKPYVDPFSGLRNGLLGHILVLGWHEHSCVPIRKDFSILNSGSWLYLNVSKGYTPTGHARLTENL